MYRSPYCRRAASLHGQEQVIIRSGKAAAPVEIAVKRLHDGLVQRHEPALVELGFADMQNPAGQYVAKPQIRAPRIRAAPWRQ